MAGILKVDKYQDFNGNDIMTSDGSGNITINNAALKMTPAFEAYLGSEQAIAWLSTTKLQINTEIIDSNNCFDTSTYRFTPTVAGKYYIYGQVRSYTGSSTDNRQLRTHIFKNGSEYREIILDMDANYGAILTTYADAILDMNGTTDYVELYATSVSADTAGQVIQVGTKATYFGGYKLIGV